MPYVLRSLCLLGLAATATANERPPPVSEWLDGLDSLERTQMLPADFSGESSAPALNLTHRLVDAFTLPVGDQSAIVQERNWYLNHPGYLQRVFQRGERYLFHIMNELEARDMPMEIALLPVVESAYDPFAYSHGRAAGLWQIIPGTGRRFGLRQNWWYDGRRDVVEATRAALTYLQFLSRRYDGDWLLAIAAYNSGEGNVDKALRANRKAGQPLDFFSLARRLPRETRAYVPRFLALADLVANAEQYGVALPDIADRPTFAVVDTGSQLDLALAAELAGIDIDTLYSFNPAYNRWATAPDGPHKLVIPIEYADRFRLNFATVPENARMRWLRHKVKPGQTLSEIAEMYATSTRSLRDANKIRNNLIRAGDHILVPASTKPLDAYTQSAEQRLSRTQNRQRPGKRTTHLVSAGESFWSLANRYNVDVKDLARWNGMAPGDTLAAGRSLVVWTRGETRSPAPGANSNRQTRKVWYTVRSGDNLSAIAARFRVRVADLTRWNELSPSAICGPANAWRCTSTLPAKAAKPPGAARARSHLL